MIDAHEIQTDDGDTCSDCARLAAENHLLRTALRVAGEIAASAAKSLEDD